MKNPLTPAGIEPATYRFVAHCATAVPSFAHVGIYKILVLVHMNTFTEEMKL